MNAWIGVGIAAYVVIGTFFFGACTDIEGNKRVIVFSCVVWPLTLVAAYGYAAIKKAGETWESIPRDKH